ncbi:hypothetical protein AAH030_10505 [Phocaeicola vulgatus]|nr:hypothetical protein [Phocaeicola vulgatus]
MLHYNSWLWWRWLFPSGNHDATRKKATAAEKKRTAGTITESGK